MSRAEDMLIEDEGMKLKPYNDTVGKLTIGVGRNLDDNGISEDEALYLMHNDLDSLNAELIKLEWYQELDEVREDVILNMAFNLGLPRLLGFKKMIKALKDKDYVKAAEEMLSSKWATQVKKRAFRLAEMMRTAEYPYEP